MTSNEFHINQLLLKWSTSNMKNWYYVSWYNAMKSNNITYIVFLPNCLTWILPWGNSETNPDYKPFLKTPGDLNSLQNFRKTRKKGKKTVLKTKGTQKPNVIYNTYLDPGLRIRKVNRLKGILRVTGDI